MVPALSDVQRRNGRGLIPTHARNGATSVRQPLIAETRAVPRPARGSCAFKVCACGVCRTDLHLVDGELPAPRAADRAGARDRRSDRCGRQRYAASCGRACRGPWLGWTDGCATIAAAATRTSAITPASPATQIDGGYAEYCLVDERFCLSLPPQFDAEHAAPLLCAGLIGYRCLTRAGDAQRLGLYGFGASAHLIAQIGAGPGA